jgi:hypothetical protein
MLAVRCPPPPTAVAAENFRPIVYAEIVYFELNRTAAHRGLSTQETATLQIALDTQEQGHRTKDTVPRTQDQGHRTKDTGPRTQDQGHRTKDTGPRTQDQGHRTKDIGQSTQDTADTADTAL